MWQEATGLPLRTNDIGSVTLGDARVAIVVMYNAGRTGTSTVWRLTVRKFEFVDGKLVLWSCGHFRLPTPTLKHGTKPSSRGICMHFQAIIPRLKRPYRIRQGAI